MAKITRCQQCGGMLDSFGLLGCDDPRHPEPDTAQAIALAIETDLRDRRGFSWDGIEDETQEKIRARWAAIVRTILRRRFRTLLRYIQGFKL